MQIVRRRISYNKLNKVADIFSGLSHPIRLEILESLEDGSPKAVGEILKDVRVDATLLSHHLSKMKNLGILESTREGRNIFYRLGIQEISNVLDCIQNCRI